MSTAGIVLCGGLSSRMGRDKVWLPWRGQPLLGHVVRRLCESVDEVLVVTALDQEIPPVAARRIRDRAPHLGPLAGIREGLEQMRSSAAFVTATDAPFLTARFVRELLRHAPAAAAEIDGFVQTLSAVYPASAAPLADQLLEAGQRRPLDLLENLEFVRVPSATLPDLDSVRGFNTPAQYLAAARADQPGATAQVSLPGEPQREVPIGTLAEVLDVATRQAGCNPLDASQSALQVRIGEGLPIEDFSIPVGAGEKVSVGPR